jgi:hypothetical protein
MSSNSSVHSISEDSDETIETLYEYDIQGHVELIKQNIQLKTELKYMRELIDLKLKVFMLEKELEQKRLKNEEYLKNTADIQKALFEELKSEFCDVDSFDKYVAERRNKN